MTMLVRHKKVVELRPVRSVNSGSSTKSGSKGLYVRTCPLHTTHQGWDNYVHLRTVTVPCAVLTCNITVMVLVFQDRMYRPRFSNH